MGGESNDTRLLILRNLLRIYERKNRKTRCMAASTVQNHVQQIGRGSPFNTVSGRVWILAEGIKYFAGDVSEREQKVWSTHYAAAPRTC